MEIGSDDLEFHGANDGKKQWYVSKGIGSRGQEVTQNFLVATESELASVAHAANIVNNVSTIGKAELIGDSEDYSHFGG